jgi:hypothetical protein
MRSITHLAVAAVAAATLTAAQGPAVPARPDDKTILHVLNRTGFGPRPGDIERVRQEGIASYIDRQLRPEKIDDGDIERRLASLETLRLSSRELADGYFEPAIRARRQQAASAAAPEGMTADAAPSRTPMQMEAARRAREPLVELSAQ